VKNPVSRKLVPGKTSLIKERTGIRPGKGRGQGTTPERDTGKKLTGKRRLVEFITYAGDLQGKTNSYDLSNTRGLITCLKSFG